MLVLLIAVSRREVSNQRPETERESESEREREREQEIKEE